MKIHLERLAHLLTTALLLLFIRTGLRAQPVCQVQQFSVHSGLSQKTVTAIVQDPKGFIWFSTWNGLNKFDGYQFTNYKAYPGDGCTLTSNRLSGIVASRYTGIWCQTYDNRVFLFDPRQERFIDILLPFEQADSVQYTVRSLQALNSGITWIICDQATFRIDELRLAMGDDAAIRRLTPDTGGLPQGTLHHIHLDSEGDEWLFASQGTAIIGRKTLPAGLLGKSFCESGGKMYLLTLDNRLAVFHFNNSQVDVQDTPYPTAHLNMLKSIGTDSIVFGVNEDIALYFPQQGEFRYVKIQASRPSDHITRIHRDSQDGLWIFTDKAGVTRYDLATGRQRHFVTQREDLPLSERSSRDLVFEDGQGTVWIIPHDGSLCYYDPETEQLRPFYTDYYDASTRFNPSILNYFVDRQQNLWFANNFGMGKMTFFPNASRITPFDKGFETRAFLADHHGNLWVANKRGYVRLFAPDGQPRGYLTADGRISPSPANFGASVYCFMEDDKGDIWVGTKWDGVWRLHLTAPGHFAVSQYRHRDTDPYSLSNNSVYSLLQDSRGRIWVGTYGGGINLLQRDADGRTRFLHSGNVLRNYPEGQCAKVRILHEVGDVMMVGTTRGLITFDLDFSSLSDIRFFRNSRQTGRASSLSANDIIDIYSNPQNEIYVLSFTGGVNRVLSPNLLTDSIAFRTYTKRDGLASDLVLSMIEDDDQRLWIVSENFLSRFDPATERFENYSRQYFQGDPYFSEALPILHQGKLILGTDGGYISLDLNRLRKSSYCPPIVLTGMQIQGKVVERDVDGMETITLSPSERNLSFSFAALDYVDPSGIKYAYRMKGLEKEWNEVDDTRRASYINLPHGQYELQIRSTNSEGIIVDNTRSIPVTVRPRFHETGWAVALYILLFLLLSAAVATIIVYILHLRYRINLEQQLTQVKLRFFTDISHELRVPLTLITSPVTEVLEHEKLSDNGRKYLTLVHRNTERMLSLVNQILDFRKIENKKMKLTLEQTDVIDLVDRVMDNFRLTAQEKHIDFTLHTNVGELFAWVDRDKLEKITSNLLSNAFKYTPDERKVTVSVSANATDLIISVADQGIGIAPEAQQHLFQRFETLVHKNILQPSSGIGLSLVRELTELHQGSISVESEQGVGSTFSIILPTQRQAYEKLKYAEFIEPEERPEMADDKAMDEGDEQSEAVGDADQATAKAIQNTWRRGRKKKALAPEGATERDKEKVCILVVEDNQELFGFLETILTSAGYQVVGATNGQEGLDKALSDVPDLIISDVLMPVMDGLDMVRAIKRNRNICHIPIILLSAKSSLDDRIRGIEQGIDDYITKPFSATYLKKRIKALLHQREQLQRTFLRRWTEQQQHGEPSPQPVQTIVEVSPAKPVTAPSLDEEFIRQVMEFVEERMQDHSVSMEEFAQHVNMGRSVFYHKLKAIFGLSPVEFMREMRLKRAKQLVESDAYSVATISAMTGFNDPKYFSKCYTRRFGVPPSEHQRKFRDERRSEGQVNNPATADTSAE